MHLDAADLRAFYSTPLGGAARRIISQRLRNRWRRAHGLVVMGLGYASPYLGSFRSEAARLAALMPADQGAIIWPSSGPVRSVMVDEEMLPLADNSVDRLLIVHCLETAGGHARGVLREAWRVLAPEGRIILVVPNRRGVWARRDATPFGHGQPYSRGQLEKLLVDTLFTPIDWSTALHVPPVGRRMVLNWAAPFERLGQRLWPLFAGVLIVEARKETTAPIVKGVPARSLGQLRPATSSTARRTPLPRGEARATQNGDALDRPDDAPPQPR